MRKAGIILAFALLVQGCGHKGPLFLPPPPQSAASADKSQAVGAEQPNR